MGNKNTCKKCGSINSVKSGKIRERQRYKCKDCGCNFVVGDLREKVKPEGKALAVLMYGRGKVSYGFIAKLFNVSRTSVLKWIRKVSSRLPEPEIEDTIKEIQVDEMWHFINKKKQKIWIWRALDCSRNKTIGWFIGNRSAETFRKFYKKMKHLNATFYSDEWESYRKVLPKDCLIMGKKYTIAIEQNNSNIRHFLARMTRRTKVVSKSEEMVDLSLRLCWYLNESNGFGKYQNFFYLFLANSLKNIRYNNT